ncbi:hypothetical protein lerEdw1_017329 [Lerista edwardsae]|nr:hypothetical protein lerEdw1_017329 [Lerista edwardsae]
MPAALFPLLKYDDDDDDGIVAALSSCEFCQRADDCPEKYGEKRTYEEYNLAVHYYCLDFHLNRVVLEESSGMENSPAGARPKKKNKKSYDLTAADKFWQKHKGSPFPEVAESVQQELESYRTQEDEVKRLKSIMGLEGEDEGAISMLSDNTAKLTSAVSSLPELLEKKRLIDLHTNVATAVLEHIKARKLDVYFEYEEKIMSKSTLDKSLLDMISDPDGTHTKLDFLSTLYSFYSLSSYS